MSGDGFAGTTVLVVGGAGFVGSNLVRALDARGAARIRVVDNLLSAERTDVLELPSVEFTEASITDARVLESLDDTFDYAFHLATYHGNQSSMHDPLADHENNTLTSLKLFQRLSSFRSLRRVVYSSAGCTVAEKIYGDARPTTEDDPVSLHLDSPYQISKIVGEMYANYFQGRHGLPAVIARFQNVYGPGEILGAGRWRGTPATVWRNVTPTFVYRALKGWPITLENEGRSSRDFIYVDDIVRGLMLCATAGEVGEVYNLASGVETTIRELADEINGNVPSPTEVQLAERRAWDHSGNRLGSTEKARARLGFDAEVGLREGIGRTVDWTRSNLAVIEAAIAQHREHVTVP
jgi:nucleoside-diphosphate-sugar epimerase